MLAPDLDTIRSEIEYSSSILSIKGIIIKFLFSNLFNFVILFKFFEFVFLKFLIISEI